MITIFVKFTNHADELLNGHIRMNPLEYYRGVEKILSGNTSELDNPAVYDVLEGSAGYIPMDRFGDWSHFRYCIQSKFPKSYFTPRMVCAQV